MAAEHDPTRWQHALCLACWERREPGREPTRSTTGFRGTCCDCGGQADGIGLRTDPATMPCKARLGGASTPGAASSAATIVARPNGCDCVVAVIIVTAATVPDLEETLRDWREDGLRVALWDGATTPPLARCPHASDPDQEASLVEA